MERTHFLWEMLSNGRRFVASVWWNAHNFQVGGAWVGGLSLPSCASHAMFFGASHWLEDDHFRLMERTQYPTLQLDPLLINHSITCSHHAPEDTRLWRERWNVGPNEGRVTYCEQRSGRLLVGKKSWTLSFLLMLFIHLMWVVYLALCEINCNFYGCLRNEIILSSPHM